MNITDDQDVQRGDLQQAQISWYVASLPPFWTAEDIVECRFFSLGHELAHNLIKQHNSEHEFWFSAICEAHILAFLQLLKHTPV